MSKRAWWEDGNPGRSAYLLYFVLAVGFLRELRQVDNAWDRTAIPLLLFATWAYFTLLRLLMIGVRSWWIFPYAAATVGIVATVSNYWIAAAALFALHLPLLLTKDQARPSQ